jgi:SAM-dependent methyltransferase
MGRAICNLWALVIILAPSGLSFVGRPRQRVQWGHLRNQRSPTTEEEYARIFSGDNNGGGGGDDEIGASILQQDPWQLELLRSPSKKQNPYHEMVQWYLTSWRESSVEEDIAHWGIPYSDYVREYVDPFSELIPISRGDKVYDSAVGSGWLIRGLLELKQQAVDDWSTVQWYGNDILPDALRIARREVPGGTFVLGDSANLTFIPDASFDVAMCGYIEPSPDALIAGGYNLNAIRDWVGNWVAQMSRLIKPGGHLSIGAVQEVLESYDRSEKITAAWWEECARNDCYGWGCDPSSVTTRRLRSALLEREWGPRYCVYMTKRGSERREID